MSSEYRKKDIANIFYAFLERFKNLKIKKTKYMDILELNTWMEINVAM